MFLDREELAASSSLSEDIRAALDQSERLIVLCSPAAAASRYVEEEIRWFRAHRDPRDILTIIVDGEPPNCFPPSLIEDGAEPIAADARASADGFDDAALKIIAALMKLPYAALKARDLVSRRRRTRILAGVAAVFALVSVAAMYSAWRAVEETRRANEELTRAEAAILVAVDGVASIVQRVSVGAKEGSVPTALADQLLRAADEMIAGVIDLAPTNRRLRREQGELLLQFARHHVWVGDTEAAFSAADRAVGVLSSLVETSPDDAELLRLTASALGSRGEAALDFARRDEAEADFEAALSLADKAASAAPESAEAARVLFEARYRIGSARRATSDLAGALAAHERSLDLARDWAVRMPDDLDWARKTTIALHNIGDIHVALGDPTQALAFFEIALAIARDLSARRPEDVDLVRGLAFALLRVGDTRRTAGNLETALDSYEEALTIARDVLARDPDNVIWSRDMTVALSRVGAARLALGDMDGAVANYQEALAMHRMMLERNPGHAQFGRRLVLALRDLGDAWVARKDEAAAIAAFDEARANAEALSANDPENVFLLRDMIAIDLRVGDAAAAEGEVEAALAAYRRGAGVVDGRDGALQASIELTRDKFLLLWRIAVVDPDADGEAWAKVIETLEAMEAADALTPEDARYLETARRKLAGGGG